MKKGLCVEAVAVVAIAAVFFVSVVFAALKIGLG